MSRMEHQAQLYPGLPGGSFESMRDKQGKNGSEQGNRSQRRAWAKQKKKPMPRKETSEEVPDQGGG